MVALFFEGLIYTGLEFEPWDVPILRGISGGKGKEGKCAMYVC